MDGRSAVGDPGLLIPPCVGVEAGLLVCSAFLPHATHAAVLIGRPTAPIERVVQAYYPIGLPRVAAPALLGRQLGRHRTASTFAAYCILRIASLLCAGYW